MSANRDGKAKAGKSKKERQLMKIIENSDGDDDSEHELSHYLNDRVKLMKQVLKIIKPRKIKSMAPDCMKNLDNAEINSMLLEELLGISNKRLKMIFAGQNVDEDTSSSTDPEEEKKPIDIISLDDVTDDDFIIEINSSNEDAGHSKKRHRKIKEEPPEKKIKKEKKDKPRKKDESEKPQAKSDEQNLMSVLELLELQARARAIRSQLALEATRKAQAAAQSSAPVATITVKEINESDEEDAIIVESPTFDEIVITSSESDNEDSSPKKRNKKDKDTDELSNIQSSSSSSKRENNMGGESSKEINSPSKIDDEISLSHETRTKESPRKHKGMCRKRLEKYKSMIKQAKNNLEEQPTINNDKSELLKSSSNDAEESIKLVSDDNIDLPSTVTSSNSVKDVENEGELQESISHIERRLSGDSTQGAEETEVDDKGKSDDEVDNHGNESLDSHGEGCSQDLQGSIKPPSIIKEEQHSIQENLSSIQEKPSSVQQEPSEIQEKDTKDLLLHLQEDGLVINIDDDDIDAINS